MALLYSNKIEYTWLAKQQLTRVSANYRSRGGEDAVIFGPGRSRKGLFRASEYPSMGRNKNGPLRAAKWISFSIAMPIGEGCKGYISIYIIYTCLLSLPVLYT